MQQRETAIDVSYGSRTFDYGRGSHGPTYVPGTEYEFHVPFTGDANLFHVQPTTFTSSGAPMASIRDGYLICSVRGVDLAPKTVKADLNTTLLAIKQHLAWLGHSTTAWNSTLLAKVQALVNQRRAKLLRDRNAVADLGFKIRERPGATRTYAAPVTRKKVIPIMPPASRAPWKPEPMLDNAIYERILEVVANGAVLMERSPSAFHHLGEEALRTHFLFILNSHFEGAATAETFNYEGKTDILIRQEGRNLFIAECKFWGGPKVLTETINQLLGYTSWRDTKAAILVFNKNKDFTRVLEQIKPTVQAHPNCKKLLGQHSETQWRFTFGQRDDPNREMTVAVMAFDVPQP